MTNKNTRNENIIINRKKSWNGVNEAVTQKNEYKNILKSQVKVR